MTNHTLEVLEFPRIVELLRGKCATAPGRILASNLVPEVTLSNVAAVQEKTLEMDGSLERSGSLPLGGIEDLSPLLSRAAADGAALSVEELITIMRAARAADDVLRYFSGKAEEMPKITAIASAMDPATELQAGIARAIGRDGEVLSNASPELAAIRKEMEATRAEVRALLESHLESSHVQRSLQESIITLRNGRYVLPVKGGSQGRVDGIVHDHSGSGATVFVEPMDTVPRNNALARLAQEESREIRKILQHLTELVAKYSGELSRNGTALARLDLIQAKAHLMREWGAIMPTVIDGETIVIRKGRHPLLEKSLSADGRADELVPLDLEFPEGIRTVVLTGPNTGGKTVALKTLGLFSILGQCGIGVPADEGTTLPLFEKLFADIGDEQSIDESLSSFSAHLAQMTGLLRDAGPRSLVLIDEIGTGTDPSEGAALAMALLEEMHYRGACCLVTTHLGSLKSFVHDTEGMVNASTSFDGENLKPTYHIEIGLPGTSHALEIAERLGLDKRIVERARENLSDPEREIGALLADLQKRSRELSERSDQVEFERMRIDRDRADLVEREIALREKEKSLETSALDRARKYLDESRKLVEHQVREIRTAGAEKEVVRGARQAIEEQRRSVTTKMDSLRRRPDRGEVPREIAPGMTVLVKSLDREGRVVGRGNRDGRYYVETRGLRLELDASDLRPVTKSSGRRKAKQSHRLAGSFPAKEARLEIDLRGQNAEDAREAVDKFLDDAVLSGVDRVQIIHGLGTGVLRDAIGELLAGDSRVKAVTLSRSGGMSAVEMA